MEQLKNPLVAAAISFVLMYLFSYFNAVGLGADEEATFVNGAYVAPSAFAGILVYAFMSFEPSAYASVPEIMTEPFNS